MIIRTVVYPRAALVGNPSDGYFGKTIAFTFRNFSAQVELWESPELELLPSRRDHSVFASIHSLHEDVKRHGYYGGFRLLKATAKAFLDYCNTRGIKLDNRNFTLRYRSDIPNRVGLAGSSAHGPLATRLSRIDSLERWSGLPFDGLTATPSHPSRGLELVERLPPSPPCGLRRG